NVFIKRRNRVESLVQAANPYFSNSPNRFFFCCDELLAMSWLYHFRIVHLSLLMQRRIGIFIFYIVILTPMSFIVSCEHHFRRFSKDAESEYEFPMRDGIHIDRSRAFKLQNSIGVHKITQII
ncbi:hypothetical protein PFISCL1PPCAC_28228, partial [Pristionchus fissidentatus]